MIRQILPLIVIIFFLFLMIPSFALPTKETHLITEQLTPLTGVVHDYNYTKNNPMIFSNDKFTIGKITLTPLVSITSLSSKEFNLSTSNIIFNYSITDYGYKRKWTLNFTKPANFIGSIDYIAFNITGCKQSSNYVLQCGNIEIDFSDVKDSGFDVSTSDARISISSPLLLSTSSINLDPTDQLLPNATNKAYIANSNLTDSPSQAVTEFSSAQYNTANTSNNAYTTSTATSGTCSGSSSCSGTPTCTFTGPDLCSLPSSDCTKSNPCSGSCTPPTNMGSCSATGCSALGRCKCATFISCVITGASCTAISGCTGCACSAGYYDTDISCTNGCEASAPSWIYTFQRFTFNLSSYTWAMITDLTFCYEGKYASTGGTAYSNLLWLNNTSATWTNYSSISTTEGAICVDFSGTNLTNIYNSTNSLVQFSARGNQSRTGHTLTLSSDYAYLNVTYSTEGQIYLQNMTQPFTMNHDDTKKANFFKNPVDSFSFNQSLSRLSTLLRLPTSSLSISQSTSRISSLFKSLTSYFAVSQNIQKLPTIYKSLTSSLSFTQSLYSRISSYLRPFTQSFSISQIVSRISILYKALFESFSINNTLAKLSAFFRSLTTSITVNNYISRLSTIYKILLQSFSISQITSRIALLFASIFDSIRIFSSQLSSLTSFIPYTGTVPSGAGVFKEFNFSVSRTMIEMPLAYPYIAEEKFVIQNNENTTMYPQFYFSCNVNKSIVYLDGFNSTCISNYCTILEQKLIGSQSYNIVGIPPKLNETYKITCKNPVGLFQLSGSIVIKDKDYPNKKEIAVLIASTKSIAGMQVMPESDWFSGANKAFFQSAVDAKDKIWYDLNYPIVCLTIRCFNERIFYWNVIKQPIDLIIYKFDSINLLLIFIIVTIIVVSMSLKRGKLMPIK